MHDITLYAQGLTSTLANAWRYAAPRVSSLQRTTDPNGTAFLDVSGANYGTFQSTPMVRVGGSACVASEWTSDSSIQCKMAAGTGQSYAVVVTVAEQEGSTPASFSFPAPNVTSIDTVRGRGSDGRSYVALAGDTEISIFGSGFGLGDTAIQMRISKDPYNGSDVACDEANWVSDSSLSCRTRTVFENAIYGLSLEFASGNNAVRVDPAKTAAVHFAASSPTCTSFADGLADAGAAVDAGYFLMDPSFQSNDDAVLTYCGLRTEDEDISVLRLGTAHDLYRPFLWLDPVAEETISLDCDGSQSVAWNVSFHAIDHAACTRVRSWTSRQRGGSWESNALTQDDMARRPVYIREDGMPARLEFNGSFLEASQLRSSAEVLTVMIVV
ncbi:MAG: IPT/TIG domain-containing protein, partial [Promethearchaeia archaeon]